ncbi:MAG: hypothetical protein ACRCXN_13010 [Bacteroidales bacterium]
MSNKQDELLRYLLNEKGATLEQIAAQFPDWYRYNENYSGEKSIKVARAEKDRLIMIKRYLTRLEGGSILYCDIGLYKITDEFFAKSGLENIPKPKSKLAPTPDMSGTICNQANLF